MSKYAYIVFIPGQPHMLISNLWGAGMTKDSFAYCPRSRVWYVTNELVDFLSVDETQVPDEYRAMALLLS